MIGFAAFNCRDDAGEIWAMVDEMPDGSHFQGEVHSDTATMRELGYEIVSIGEFVARKRKLADQMQADRARREAALGFDDWSPAQLAAALGYRINLVGTIEQAAAYLVGHDRRSYSHGQLCLVLGRLARMKGLDPAAPPEVTPRALRNGREQPA